LYIIIIITIIIIHSFIPAISRVPLQVLYHSAWILYRSFMPKRAGNCR